MKKAIYVEGLSEMTFVYQMLLTHFDSDWMQVRINCVNLKNADTTPKPDDYGADDAPNQFLLRNVGNDESVSSMLIEGYDSLKNAGSYSKHWDDIKNIVFKLEKKILRNCMSRGEVNLSLLFIRRYLMYNNMDKRILKALFAETKVNLTLRK